MTALFQQADPDSRGIMHQIDRLGYTVTGEIADPTGESADSRVFLTDVGASRMTLVLTLKAVGETIQILRVTFGRESMTPAVAARWLKARQAR
jgi:hypothetical protein